MCDVATTFRIGPMLPTLINEIGPSNLSCRHAVRGTWEGQWKKRPAYPEVGGLKMWGDVPCNCSMCLEVIYAHWHVFEMCLCYLCLLSGNAKVAKAHKKYNKMGSNAPKALEGVTRSILSIFWADNLGLIFLDYFLRVPPCCSGSKYGNPGWWAQNVGEMCLATVPCALI